MAGVREKSLRKLLLVLILIRSFNDLTVRVFCQTSRSGVFLLAQTKARWQSFPKKFEHNKSNKNQGKKTTKGTDIVSKYASACVWF